MLYFDCTTYDFGLLTFQDRTILDTSVACGHSGSSRGLELGPTTLTGVIHPCCAVLANTNLTGLTEIEPFRFVVPNQRRAFDVAPINTSVPFGTEAPEDSEGSSEVPTGSEEKEDLVP